MELLNEHSANKIILKNKFCNETLLQENNEKISTINIDEIGPCEFMCFEEKDVEIMKKYYRIICNFSTEFQNSSKFSPIVMLPEQVQILLENGFAIVRRVKTIISDDNSVSTQFFNSFSVDEQILNDNNEELVMLARKVALGRRIKDIKRKRYGSEASSTNLKVCKIDNKTFENEISKFITEAEVKSIAQELYQNKLNQRKKFNYKQNNNINNLYYELVEHPSFPNTLKYSRCLKTFRDLWRKGFYLTSGIKFGCDYLAYEKPPGESHSTFMVNCIDSTGFDKTFKPLNLISAVRVSSQVKKQLLLSIVSSDSLIPYYIQTNWWKGEK